MYRESLCIKIEARLHLHSIPNKKVFIWHTYPCTKIIYHEQTKTPENLPPKPIFVKPKYPSFPFKCYEFLTHSP